MRKTPNTPGGGEARGPKQPPSTVDMARRVVAGGDSLEFETGNVVHDGGFTIGVGRSSRVVLKSSSGYGSSGAIAAPAPRAANGGGASGAAVTAANTRVSHSSDWNFIRGAREWGQNLRTYPPSKVSPAVARQLSFASTSGRVARTGYEGGSRLNPLPTVPTAEVASRLLTTSPREDSTSASILSQLQRLADGQAELFGDIRGLVGRVRELGFAALATPERRTQVSSTTSAQSSLLSLGSSDSPPSSGDGSDVSSASVAVASPAPSTSPNLADLLPKIASLQALAGSIIEFEGRVLPRLEDLSGGLEALRVRGVELLAAQGRAIESASAASAQIRTESSAAVDGVRVAVEAASASAAAAIATTQEAAQRQAAQHQEELRRLKEEFAAEFARQAAAAQAAIVEMTTVLAANTAANRDALEQARVRADAEAQAASALRARVGIFESQLASSTALIGRFAGIIAAGRAEIEAERAAVKAEIADRRAEAEAEIANLKAESRVRIAEAAARGVLENRAAIDEMAAQFDRRMTAFLQDQAARDDARMRDDQARFRAERQTMEEAQRRVENLTTSLAAGQASKIEQLQAQLAESLSNMAEIRRTLGDRLATRGAERVVGVASSRSSGGGGVATRDEGYRTESQRFSSSTQLPRAAFRRFASSQRSREFGAEAMERDVSSRTARAAHTNYGPYNAAAPQGLFRSQFQDSPRSALPPFAYFDWRSPQYHPQYLQQQPFAYAHQPQIQYYPVAIHHYYAVVPSGFGPSGFGPGGFGPGGFEYGAAAYNASPYSPYFLPRVDVGGFAHTARRNVVPSPSTSLPRERVGDFVHTISRRAGATQVVEAVAPRASIPTSSKPARALSSGSATPLTQSKVRGNRASSEGSEGIVL